MGNVIKSVVKVETFLLDYSDHRDLVGCQWPASFKWWFLYRSITLLYLLVLLVVGFTSKFMRYQWKLFIYVTHWAFLVFVFNHLLKWICLIKYRKWFSQRQLKDTPDEEKPLLFRQQSWITNYEEKNHSLLSFSWAVANVANVFTVFVTITYWSNGNNVFSLANLPEVLNFQMHGVNAAMTVLDLILVAQPTLLLHFYQPILFLCSYYSFTAFYYVAGGTNKYGTRYMYSYLDWDNPEMTLLSLSKQGLLVLIIHTAMWLIAVIRTGLGQLIRNKNTL